MRALRLFFAALLLLLAVVFFSSVACPPRYERREPPPQRLRDGLADPLPAPLETEPRISEPSGRAALSLAPDNFGCDVLVLDAETRLPIAGAVVKLGWRTERFSGVVTPFASDAEGRVAFRSLPAGEYPLLAGCPGYFEAEPLHLRLPSVKQETLTFLLRPGALLRGRVQRADGGRVGAAWIRLRPAGGGAVSFVAVDPVLESFESPTLEKGRWEVGLVHSRFDEPAPLLRLELELAPRLTVQLEFTEPAAAGAEIAGRIAGARVVAP